MTSPNTYDLTSLDWNLPSGLKLSVNLQLQMPAKTTGVIA